MVEKYPFIKSGNNFRGNIAPSSTPAKYGRITAEGYLPAGHVYQKPNLPPGWSMDDLGNFKTDTGWMILKDQSQFQSPDGTWYTKDDIQKSEQRQKDLTTLFPDTDIKELSDYAEKDPQKFIEHFQQVGDTPLARSVLKSLGLQDDSINSIYSNLPQGYEYNDQGKLIQNAALPKPGGGLLAGFGDIASFKNPYREGGPWQGDQAMSTVDIHNPLSVATVAIPMELMGGLAIPRAIIGAAADVLGPGWQTAMGVAGMDTSAAVAPDYIGKIASAIMGKLGGSAEKTAAKFVESGLARGAKMDEIAASLPYIKGIKQETIEKLTGIKLPDTSIKMPGMGAAVAPKVDGAPSATPILDKLNRASAALGKSSVSTSNKWQQRIRTLQEQVFDKYYGINRAGGQVKSNVEEKLSLLSGAANKGVQIAQDVYGAVKSAIGEVDEQYVSAYLKLIHNQDILAAHPDRKITGGLLGQMELQQGLQELKAVLGAEGYAKVEQAGKALTDHWAAMLYEMVDSGLVSQETADMLRQMYPHYNPTKYIERLLDETGGTGKAASVMANDLKSLSEEGSEAITANPLNVLLMDTIKKQVLIDRNDAAKAIAEMVANNAEIAAQAADGSIFYMENGKKITVDVPKWLENEAKLMDSQVTGAAAGVMRFADALNQVSRLGMTGINIAFFVPNFAVDCLTAWLNAGVGPLVVCESLAKNLKGIFKQDEWVRRYNLAGGGMSGFSGKSTREIILEAEKSGNIALRNLSDWRRLLNPVTFIEEIGHAVEMAPRVAAFKKGIQGGMTDAAAAVQGRRATVDFSRSGTALQYLNHFYLFLNAGVQGSALPFRMLKNDPRSRTRLAMFTAASAGLYLYNQAYPEYADVPDYAKYGSLIIMLPSEKFDATGQKIPRYICAVPNSREWSMFHGSLQYVLANLMQKDPGNLEQFLTAWFPNINPASKFIGGGAFGTGIVPTQIGRTSVDVSTNTDSFRMKPIVPIWLAKLPAPEQYDQYTSETAVKLGAMLNYSPKLIDYWIVNIFGGVGSQITDSIDWAINTLDNEQPDFKIQRLTEQLKAIQVTVPAEMKGADPLAIQQEIVKRRTEFLKALLPEEKKLVLVSERQPEPRIPLITTIIGRIYRERGGQLLLNEKQKAAEEKTADNSQTETATTAETPETKGSDNLSFKTTKTTKPAITKTKTPSLKPSPAKKKYPVRPTAKQKTRSLRSAYAPGKTRFPSKRIAMRKATPTDVLYPPNSPYG